MSWSSRVPRTAVADPCERNVLDAVTRRFHHVDFDGYVRVRAPQLGRDQCAGTGHEAQGQQRQRIAAACGIARYRPTEVLFPTSAPAWRQSGLRLK